MATTGMWSVKSRLDHLVNYVSNPLKTVTQYVINEDKTMEKRYVTYINCSFDNPKASMENTKKHYHDESEILAFHGYQSFEEDEIDADLAHQLGVLLAQKIWENRFEVIVSTHLDTDNIHNHFLVNSTSFKDGKRYCNTYKDIYKMRKVSDELCLQYGLSIVEEKKNIGRSRQQYFQAKTLREMIREDVDSAINVSYTDRQFYRELELQGYEIKISEKNISVKHPMHQRFVRLKSLGREYEKEKVFERILNINKSNGLNRSFYSKYNFNIESYFIKYKQRKLTGLQKLFLHYQYILKIIPRDNRTHLSTEYKNELREAVKKLDELSQQTIILCTNNISTIDELNVYMNDLHVQLNSLEKQRTKYRNDIRKYDDISMKNELKEKAKELTPKISKLRKNLALCQKIEERSLNISRFIEPIERKKVRKHERN